MSPIEAPNEATRVTKKPVQLALGLAVAFAIAGLTACLDTAPIYVTEQASTKGDAAIPPIDLDGSVEGGDAAPVIDCVTCLETAATPGPGCKPAVDTCGAIDRCKRSYVCAVTTGCFRSTTLEDFFACGLVCANDAGVVDFSDDAFKDEYAIFQCALTTCAAYCKFAKNQDGGL